MKVLFIKSNNKQINNPIIHNQVLSLEAKGIEIIQYGITGTGFCGYIKNLKLINNIIKRERADIVHAHYSFSGFVASLAFAKPLVVSLMGSDVFNSNFLFKLLIRICNLFFWDVCLVKSDTMALFLGMKGIKILPNGVDILKFIPVPMEEARQKIGWGNQRYILFGANPNDSVKNFKLAQSAFSELSFDNCELISLVDIPNLLIPYYLSAADVLLLTSYWEGSPNIIKESMACNCPIVATNVGDIKLIIGDTEGCFITDFDIKSISQSLTKALLFNKRTKGRDQICKLGLDSETISDKLITIYNDTINKKRIFKTFNCQ